MSSSPISCLQIRLSVLIHISCFPSIQRRPFGVFLEQTHSLNVVLIVGSEAVVDPRRQNYQIVLLESDSDPIVIFGSDIEVAGAVTNISDLLIFMEVLVEEHLHLGLVHLAHGLRRDCDLISVLVAALSRKTVDGREVWVVGVEDADGSKC